MSALSFEELMTKLREGDEAAAKVVFQRSVRRLIGLATKQFDHWFRHKVDLEGVVQSAYKSFFLGHRQGQYEVDDWESLWGLLALITLRKCNRRREYLLADRRDAGREVSGSWAEKDTEDFREFEAHEASPLEEAMLNETVLGVLQILNFAEREIVQLSLQGYTTPEIAERLGRSRRTVQRVRERLKNTLHSLLAENSDDSVACEKINRPG